MDHCVVLKPGKEKAICHRHHWIFSGAIAHFPSCENGSLLSVVDAKGRHLGFGYFNRRCNIAGRMVSFDQTPPLKAIEESICKAIKLRRALFSDQLTTAYRLINGEGDQLPGLIVDQYADVLVIQISTLGIDLLKSDLVEILLKLLKPRCIFEKSTSPSRKEEGLSLEVQQTLYGELPESVEILEEGLRYLVFPKEGQKTGFFLDQREMRALVRKMAKGKKVLNCFSYSGGFSVAALAGGAEYAISVEISAQAIAWARENVQLNGYSNQKNAFFQTDVFEFLKNQNWQADFVVLDPPAFAKRQKDVMNACRGYKEINRLAMLKMPSGSLLLTCSCSYFVDEALFQNLLFQAAYEAKKCVKIISKHHLAEDHPINVFHPEGNYLKSFLLYVDDAAFS